MIAYFPTPYPDEIFYSLIARIYKHLSIQRPKELLKELFGTTTISATLDFPSHLQYFHKSTHMIFNKSVDDIIKDHTLLPLYASFISENNLKYIRSSMAGTSGDIHTRIGITAGINAAIVLPRYCPICFEKDKATYGEAYWHRSHQIPSFNYCPLHNCQLLQAEIDKSRQNKHFFIPSDEIYCVNKQICFNTNDQIHILINRVASFLYRPAEFKNDPYYYRDILIKKGFIKGNKHIDQAKLAQMFASFYSKATLVYFKTEVHYNSSNCWLKSISRRVRKSVDPIRHALLENFLENYHSSSTTSVFGIGPWVCLNPVCAHFKLAVIKQIHITYDTKSRRSIGHLTCKCGFTYTQSYLEKQQKHFCRVKVFGYAWEEKLQQLLMDHVPIWKIATILQCYPKTVKLQIKRFHIPICANIDNFSEKQRLKRKEWLHLLSDNKDKSISELKANAPALYMWLYRNDREWLYAIKYKKTFIKPGKYNINWSNRDQQYVEELKLAYQKVLIDNKIRWLNKSLLIKQTTSKATLEKHLHKLPLCRNFIECVTETKEAYRVRKIYFCEHLLNKAGEKIEKWKLLRMARVRKEYISQHIEKILSDILTK